MVDIAKQIEYWSKSAVEDIEAATDLITNAKHRHGLFFAHLALEKLLKACVCKATGAVAPRIHNLSRLAESAGIEIKDEMLDFLAEMNEFNMEGRYPVPFLPATSKQEAEAYITKSKEAIEWLTQQL